MRFDTSEYQLCHFTCEIESGRWPGVCSLLCSSNSRSRLDQASAAVPGIIYALLGSSRQLNVAPEAALSLLVGQAVAIEMNERPHSYPADPTALSIAVATIITFQVGVFSFLLGIFRLGFIDVVLSRALLRGFVTAIVRPISAMSDPYL